MWEGSAVIRIDGPYMDVKEKVISENITNLYLLAYYN